MFFDLGTTENSKWTVGSGLTKTVGSEYTTLSSTYSTSFTGRCLSNTTFTGDFEVSFQVKLIYENSWAGYIGFYDTNQTIWRLGINDWRYIKMGRLNGTYYAKLSNDGSTWSDMTIGNNNASTTGAVKCMLYIYNAQNTEKTMTFRNLKVYSI